MIDCEQLRRFYESGEFFVDREGCPVKPEPGDHFVEFHADIGFEGEDVFVEGSIVEFVGWEEYALLDDEGPSYYVRPLVKVADYDHDTDTRQPNGCFLLLAN